MTLLERGMARIRIVTDSACDLTDAEATDAGVVVVPLTIRFGTDEYRDRDELSVEDFYRLMDERDELPSTAAPSPGAFETAFRRQAEAGADEVLCITLSSKLSATMDSARTAATALAGELPVHVVDSGSITAGLGTQVLTAAAAAADGADAEELTALVADLRARTRVFGCLDSLENLKKGGRIGGAQAMLGSLLSIKPMIDISTGVVEEAGKSRTRRKSLESLRDRLFERPGVEKLAIMHGMAPDIDTMLALVDERYGPDDRRVGHIGAVIGSHGGPRVIGACWVDPAPTATAR